MSHSILKALTAERIERLKLSFSSSQSVFWNEDRKMLIHAGEYGVYRERAVHELLRLYTPDQFGIGTGFIITNQGGTSTQCDLVIFDRLMAPGIVTDSHQAFFPVESVVAVGEVKSDLKSFSILNSQLDKLALTKALREQITNPSPYRSHKKQPFRPAENPFDHMFTFLICHRFRFRPEPTLIKYGDAIEPRFRHNMVISIEDGAFCYSAKNGPRNFPYPTTGGEIHQNKWMPATSEPVPSHFAMFLASFYNAMNNVTLLEPDMTLYVTDNYE